jgi:hypothetical protein
MKHRCCAAAAGLILSLSFAATASAVDYTPGSRSLGDTLLPALGNGGYDTQHYDLDIDYVPGVNTMTATTGITSVATQNLSEFSLDLKAISATTGGLTVTAVTVDDQPAAALARDADKLIVTPAAGIDTGSTFRTVVAYNGTPQRIRDPDNTQEGWLNVADGAFVVNEPMGAMGWFPNNNSPQDKATYDITITVPTGKVALGNGELVSKTDNPSGTTSWHWRESYPMATYLTTATVGDFDLTEGTGATALGGSGSPLKLYNAIDSTYSAAIKTANLATFNREDAIVKFLADLYGPYPFDSAGAVVDRVSGVGYVLEVQTKIHFPSSGNNGVSVNTLSHELTHQWFGDSVSLEQWTDIWLNEGWATWSQWNWTNQANGGITPAQQFLNNYNSTATPTRWNTPTAVVPSAAFIFDTFPVYTRGAMTLEALRQIIGDGPFFELARRWPADHRYGNATTAEFIALAKQIARDKAGFESSNLAKLDTFFQQWLYTPGKPTMTPTTFFQRTDVPGDAGGTVPGTLALAIGAPASFGAFTPGVARDYTATMTANVLSTAGDAALTVSDPSSTAPGRLVNGSFALAQPLQARIAPAGVFGAIGSAPLPLTTTRAR